MTDRRHFQPHQARPCGLAKNRVPGITQKKLEVVTVSDNTMLTKKNKLTWVQQVKCVYNDLLT